MQDNKYFRVHFSPVTFTIQSIKFTIEKFSLLSSYIFSVNQTHLTRFLVLFTDETRLMHLHALGCVSNNSCFPTGLFQSKFGKGTEVPKILNDCMSCWNRSCQWERYPTRSPRERPSLNVTPARYQGRHRGRSSLRMHGKLQAEVAALDTRGPSMCYKTKWLAYRTTSSKMKFRFASFGERFTVQEHSLCWVFFFVSF